MCVCVCVGEMRILLVGLFVCRVKSEGRESSGIRPLINDSMVFLGVRTSSAVAKDVTGMVIVGFGYLLVWVCYDR